MAGMLSETIRYSQIYYITYTEFFEVEKSNFGQQKFILEYFFSSR